MAFDFQNMPKVFKKKHIFKIWLQRSQIGNPGLQFTPLPAEARCEEIVLLFVFIS